MNNDMYGILFTFLVGISFLVVLIISKYLKKNNNFVIFALGLSFTIMIGMIMFDLLPEVYELFGDIAIKIPLIIIISLLGFGILYSLDILIPDHHEESDKLNKDNLLHISIITTVALVIHNFIEGASLYTVTLTSIKSGLLMSIAVILHNIPLAFTIMLSLGKNKKRNVILILSLILSSLLGGIFINLFKLSNFVLGCIISVTLGMIIYLIVVELYKEIKKEIKNKYCYLGLILGIVLVVLSFLI